MANLYKTDNMETPRRGRHGQSIIGENTLHGIFVATVTNTTDSIYTGRIKVRLGEQGSDPVKMAEEWVLMCTPYGGVTNYADAIQDDPTAYGEDGSSYNGTAKSYGMWPQPPVVGTEVIVAFTPAMKEGLFIGTLMKRDRNHMMGGRASGLNPNGEIRPVGEKNPYDGENPDNRPEDTRFTEILEEQGLIDDYARGHSMSSARRETPSNVFGITTLNGHTFTMDDGTGEGDSRNIRLRTRDGAQILLDDTNKQIFITNHKGNAWVEIDENGKIDVFSEDTISMRSDGDFNIHTKSSFNVQAEQGINLRASGSPGINIDASLGNLDMYTQSTFNIQAAVNGNLKVAGSYKETAARIDMNGPVADDAGRVLVNNLVENENILISAASRVPEHHPWKGATSIQESFDTDKGKTS